MLGMPPFIYQIFTEYLLSVVGAKITLLGKLDKEWGLLSSVQDKKITVT